MVGNRTRFEEAQQRANDLVWEEKWPQAIQAYRRALKEFPEHVPTLRGYAWALFNTGEIEEAIDVYKQLTEQAPSDPGPHERLAELLAQQGEPKAAAAAYLDAARCYEQQGIHSKRITALEDAVRLNPDLPEAWSTLLRHYRDQGMTRSAVRATHWLAYFYQDDHPERAIALCRETQGVAPQNRHLGHLLRLLQSEQPVPHPPPTDELGLELESRPPSEEELLEEEEEGVSPTAIARQRALEALAESIFADEGPAQAGASQEQITLLISKALDAQTRGDLDKALEAYAQLESAGVALPSVHFNLGLIYKEKMRFEEAIAQFERAVGDENYVLAAQYALGECYQALGEFDRALEHFLEAVKVIDMATVEREQVDDLLRVYEGLAQNLVNTGEPERIKKLLPSLVDFLSQRGWEEEAIEARRRLDSLARSGAVLSLAEIISLPNSEEILQSVALAQEYIRRNKAYSALEELFHAISRAPFYLPLHSMLANLFVDNENLESSLDKYDYIARVCEVRGQIPQALATYRQILEYSPLDSKIRRRVIELLVQRGEIDEALEQYLQLADAYYQLAQPDRARETYRQALRLAPRGSDERSWEIRILHRMADLDMQRLAWQNAIKDYEQIAREAPGDERAHLGLLRLYTRTGQRQRGMMALDRLLKHYLETERLEKALAVLDDLLEEEPTSIPLRFRAARLNLRARQRDVALQHLDVLGDLQLEAGQEAAALKTIQMIINLKPPNVGGYVQLYEELSGEKPKLPT